MKVKYTLLISTLLLHASANVLADERQKIAIETFDEISVSFSEKRDVENSTLSISGPNGFSVTNTTKSGIPSIYLSDYSNLRDGQYTYQITSSIPGKAASKTLSLLNNGRTASNNKVANESVSQSGYFHIENGRIKQFDEISDSRATTSP